jgi:two-component system response regulator MprA
MFSDARGAVAMTKRILVVDDEAHSREGLRDSLAREGHAVETATNGRDALMAVTRGESPFHVAIIDVDLPRRHGALTGWEVAQACRAASPSTAIIIVVADDWAPEHATAASLGVTEILEKPISPAHVKRLLRELPAMALAAALPRRSESASP